MRLSIMININNLNVDEEETIKKMRQAYFKEIDYIGVSDTDKSRFSWTQNKYLEFHIFKVFSADSLPGIENLLICSLENKKDNLIYHDLYDQTHSYDFEQLHQTESKLNYLIEKNDLKINSEHIILNSIDFFCYSEYLGISSLIKGLEDYAKKYAKKEYENSKKSLEQRNVVESFPFSNKKIFIDKYHFNNMLKNINNDQFTDEFNQCLFAYEHEKWFISAAGLGSCIEHLMLIIIHNYQMDKKLNSRNPTASDYIRVFTQKPIGIDSRQQRFFYTLFGLRNSVDHHNSGYTSKNICDVLLSGITDIYNDYYLLSTKQ